MVETLLRECCDETFEDTKRERYKHRQRMAKAGVECPLENKKPGRRRTVFTPDRRKNKRLWKQKEREKKKADANPGVGGKNSNHNDELKDFERCDSPVTLT